jgi:hypothetical protein
VTSSFPHPNQGTVVWDSSSTLSGLCLRGCHPLWRAFSGHFSLTSEEEAGPLTLHLPRFSAWDSVWTFPVSLAATRGIPFWFLFLPLLRCFRSGGSRSVREHILGSPIQVSPVLRLHAPTRGCIVACRALLQLSSRAILQTAWHVGPYGGICLAFGENLTYYVRVVVCPVHGVILSLSCLAQFTASLHIRVGAELHLFFE